MIYDLVIIGGGINGAGIAADAAGRGLKVALCEQHDLASHTSSHSSKLIHGGLRYLEHYEFRLVREALKEREVLLHKAPHLIHPLSIIMPHNQHLRPSWMIRLGLFLYDHLDRKQSLPKSTMLRIDATQSNEPLNALTRKGYRYSDATVDDSRLVIANTVQAHQLGADIFTRHRVLSAQRHEGLWHVTVQNALQSPKVLTAKALINAAGPWVDSVISQQLQLESQHHVRLVKGSHIVTRQLYPGDHAYILQHEDHRIVFVIPYRNDFTLIGTTDLPYQGDPAAATISSEERDYLLTVVNHYFKTQLSTTDIVWTYSGVRPLQSDKHQNPSKVTRDYTFELHDVDHDLPVLSIFGGKITTYRKLSEHALEKLAPYFPHMKPAWTATAKLPGGECDNFPIFLQQCYARYPWLPAPLCTRLALAYGTRMEILLSDCQSLEDLGKFFGGSLYQREVEYLLAHEWAQTAEDILWRRTKQGLYLDQSDRERLQDWLSHIKSN